MPSTWSEDDKASFATFAEKFMADPVNLAPLYETQKRQRDLPDHLRNVKRSVTLPPIALRTFTLRAERLGVTTSDVMRLGLELYAAWMAEHSDDPEMKSNVAEMRMMKIRNHYEHQILLITNLKDFVRGTRIGQSTLRTMKNQMLVMRARESDPDLKEKWTDLIEDVQARLVRTS